MAVKKIKTAVILCGGKSRRMNFDKQTIKIGGRFIAEFIGDQLSPMFDEVILVTNKPELYKKSNYKIILDKISGFGPLSGIHAGLIEAKGDLVYIIAGDMPRVNIAYIEWMYNKIVNSYNEIEILVAKDNYGRIEPFNGFYNKKVVQEIEKVFTSGNHRIIDIYKGCSVMYVKSEEVQKYSQDVGMFLNLNTPEDLVAFLNN